MDWTTSSFRSIYSPPPKVIWDNPCVKTKLGSSKGKKYILKRETKCTK